MYWRYFKAALSHQGLTLRAKTVFHGTADEPCHVEIDEAVVKQSKLFGDDGERMGTLHGAVFGITQRGSRRAVVYMMTPSRPTPFHGRVVSVASLNMQKY